MHRKWQEMSAALAPCAPTNSRRWEWSGRGAVNHRLTHQLGYPSQAGRPTCRSPLNRPCARFSEPDFVLIHLSGFGNKNGSTSTPFPHTYLKKQVSHLFIIFSRLFQSQSTVPSPLPPVTLSLIPDGVLLIGRVKLKAIE